MSLSNKKKKVSSNTVTEKVGMKVVEKEKNAVAESHNWEQRVNGNCCVVT